ncbi:MAG: hypothetical protein Ta2D_07070 [Rickettsiales bacterium]|nr:MAG: hypothetical protein Ta2D_07070 [Rickettsiales bacterium]
MVEKNVVKKTTTTTKSKGVVKVVKKVEKPVEEQVKKEVVNIAAPVKKVKVKKVNNDGKIYATGKRKNAIAKVWLSEGTGNITVNNKKADEYLKRAILNTIINQPFQKTNTEGKFDIACQVLGGGLTGQAGAIKHAISIALQLLNPDLRDVLKKAGFLTRDSRVVERKKAGLKKARKGQVYQRR